MLSKARYEAYRADTARIEELLQNQPVVADTVRGSSAEPPYTQHTVKIRGIDPVRALVNRAKAYRLQKRCVEVEEDLQQVKNPKTREVLRLRYIDGLSWDEVAICVELRADACRKRAARALGK